MQIKLIALLSCLQIVLFFKSVSVSLTIEPFPGFQGLFLNALVSMTFSLMMDRLLTRVSPRALWTSTLYLFVIATTAMMLTKNVALHYLLIGATGPFYAVINALPIALINEYHEDQELFYGANRKSSTTTSSNTSPLSNHNNNNNNLKVKLSDGEFPTSPNHHHHDRSAPTSSLEMPETAPPPLPMTKRGIGADMALLDSAYFLSQVFITSSLGYLSYWTESVYVYIIFANVSALLSILTLGGVVFNAADMMTRIV